MDFVLTVHCEVCLLFKGRNEGEVETACVHPRDTPALTPAARDMGR